MRGLGCSQDAPGVTCERARGDSKGTRERMKECDF